MHRAEKLAYMADMTNARNQELIKQMTREQMEFHRRRLSGWGESFSYSYEYKWDDATSYDAMESVVSHSDVSATTMRPSASYVTHFDLWLCTRLADPSFIHEGYDQYDDGDAQSVGGTGAILGLSYPSTSNIAAGNYHAPSYTLNLAGAHGISAAFKYWAGIHHNDKPYLPNGYSAELMSWATNDDGSEVAGNSAGSAGKYVPRTTQPANGWSIEEMSIGSSAAFYHAMFPGACSGGYDMDDGEGLIDLAFELMEDELQHVGNGGVPRQFGVQMCQMIKDDIAANAKDSSHVMRNPFTTYGNDGYLLSIMNTFCTAYIGDDPLRVGKFELRKMNSWASYLYKETHNSDGSSRGKEYIVAFQGTKGSDIGMIQYNTRRNPIFVFVGDRPAIIPNGFYDYMSSLIFCLDDQQDETYRDSSDNWVATSPAFITGHSLGGAASTLYASSRSAWVNPSGNTFPRLVTFGAGPTAYTGAAPSDGQVIKCADKELTADSDQALANDVGDYCSNGVMTSAGFHKYSTDLGGLGNYCVKSNSQGIRFIHKFDPVASLTAWNGQYGHAVENTIMVMDAVDTGCSTGYNTGCDISGATLQTGKGYADLGLDGTNPDNVKVWMCTKHSVKPCTWWSKCTDYYTSYQSGGTQNPCAQLQFQRQLELFAQSEEGQEAYSDIKQHFGGTEQAGLMQHDWSGDGLTSVWKKQMIYNLFKEHEGFAACASDWYATTAAWLNAAMVDATGIMWAITPFMFGFTWVHSTYGFYPLCANRDGNGDFTNFCADKHDPNWLHSCTQDQLTALSTFCIRPGYIDEGHCYARGIDNSCMAICDYGHENSYALYANGDSSTSNSAVTNTYPNGFRQYCLDQLAPTPAPVYSGGSGSGTSYGSGSSYGGY